MALRHILTQENPALRRKCRPYTEFGHRLHQLLDDMGETLTQANGVGLAAPQVGILRRACVVLETNVPEGEEYIFELVNPEILLREGEQEGTEGCLSLPGQFGIVRRPERVVVRAQDRYGNVFEREGLGLTARAICHEVDHLDGKLFVDLAERMLTEEELEEMYGNGEDEAE